MRQAAVICYTELKLLARNRATATFAIALPLAVGAFLAWQRPDFGLDPAAVWPAIVAVQMLAILGFAVYITTTSTFAARRQNLFLKRLRSGEASDQAIVMGTALPALLLGLLQIAIVMAFSTVAGAPWPSHPLLILWAVVGTAAMCVAAGLLTSCITQGAEHAQFTTAPFFFVLLVGGILVMREGGEASFLQIAIPGGAVSEMVRLAWESDVSWRQDILPVAPLLGVWIALPASMARRLFRWAPRA